jgi:hypothetical protein
VRIAGPDGAALRTGAPASVEVAYRSREERPEVLWSFRIATPDLTQQITSGILFPGGAAPQRLVAGSGRLGCRIPRLPLLQGTYALRAAIAEPDGSNLLALHGWERPTMFEVAAPDALRDNLHRLSGDLVTLEVEPA